MKNLFCFVLFVSVLCLCSLKTQATHNYGGEISYKYLSPGTFEGTYIGYYDPSANIANSTIDFKLSAPACNTATIITVPKQSSRMVYINGGIPNKCSASSSKLVQAVTYTVIFTPPFSQTSCSEWILSVQECNKMGVDNLLPFQNTCLYVEASINLLAANLKKSSPVFLQPDSWVFNVNSPATYNNLAIGNNAEGDSIVYSLKPALNANNSPISYAPNTSFSQPLPTSSGVTLHPKTGVMTFTPNVFNSSPPATNSYTVVVEAGIYRRLNGVLRKIGSSQRSLPIFITQSAANANPEVNATINGQPVLPNEIFQIPSGNTLSFQFTTADANAGDSLKLFMPDPQLPGLPANPLVVLNSGIWPSGSLTFNLPASASDYLFYFPVTVLDNACPVRGVTTRVFGVKVLGGPLGMPDAHLVPPKFSVSPNPFSEEVRFTLGAQTQAKTIRIYNLLGQQLDEIEIPVSGFNERQINWGNAYQYATGTYLARLISEGKTVQTLKFVKQ